MARHNPADLARTAYEAYGESTLGLTHDGRSMPAWDDLSDRVQVAWAAAAVAVIRQTTPREEGP
ncbi:hypothetical protein ACIQPQ_34275 [Streptomyces sp. NPDC091281]|uniref:hypothetical protein n=1 Tax=Streptomyces sp. NPDC091281 TaxID=3365985 RepID=UPI00381CA1B0